MLIRRVVQASPDGTGVRASNQDACLEPAVQRFVGRVANDRQSPVLPTLNS